MLLLVLTGASNASGGLGAESACLHMVQLNWSSVSEGKKRSDAEMACCFKHPAKTDRSLFLQEHVNSQCKQPFLWWDARAVIEMSLQINFGEKLRTTDLPIVLNGEARQQTTVHNNGKGTNLPRPAADQPRRNTLQHAQHNLRGYTRTTPSPQRRRSFCSHIGRPCILPQTPHRCC
jgi:hypothetical protein